MSESTGEINFSPNIIARKNREFIESTDITPDQLADFINEHEEKILERIEFLYQRERSTARNPQNVKRVSIHTARLALAGYERGVFVTSSLSMLQRVTNTPEDLNHIARPFWDAMESTNFAPLVVTRLGANVLEGTKGTWLSVKKIEQIN